MALLPLLSVSAAIAPTTLRAGSKPELPAFDGTERVRPDTMPERHRIAHEASGGGLTTCKHVGTHTLKLPVGRGIVLWCEKLFAGMQRNASTAAHLLNLPKNRIADLGTKVEV